MDIILSNWGATVEGFDFNPISIERANKLGRHFDLGSRVSFHVGDVDTYVYSPGYFDISASFGVIAHVPDQKNMFYRMADSCRRGGYVILGYIEDSGLIQRLLHRAIVLVNSDKSDKEIFRIAKSCFAEHIERSVKYGGRTADSVINDYLVNPHYIGISSQTLMSWAVDCGLEYYSTWPNIELPFVVDSPYFKLIPKDSQVYKVYFSLLRLRWMYSQHEDAEVFGEMISCMPNVEDDIESLFVELNEILQNRNFENYSSEAIKKILKDIELGISTLMLEITSYVNQNLHDLNAELIRILEKIVRKTRDGDDFELDKMGGKLFKGYNGLATSYVVFHKQS
jgi:SAM-dependent methyltransferase